MKTLKTYKQLFEKEFQFNTWFNKLYRHRLSLSDLDDINTTKDGIDTLDDDNISVLYNLIIYDYPFTFIEKAINYGADVNLIIKKNTVLEYQGEDNIINIQNTNSLFIAALSLTSLKGFKLIIEQGANWNIKNNDGKDFMDFLDKDTKEDIINNYPDKYQDFLDLKNMDKFNI